MKNQQRVFSKDDATLRSQIATLSEECELVANCDRIRRRIYFVRGVQVMLAPDLADLYQVSTGVFNQSVKRNAERFPENFRFQLNKEELDEVITICDNPGRLRFSPALPYVFTEQGIAMLSGVLRSKVAVRVSIRIMETFVAMRRFVSDHEGLVQRVGAIEMKQLETDKRIDTVFDALDRGNLLPIGILPASSEFDSFRYVARLIESATSEIVLIDPYSDAVTLEVLAKKQKGVKVRLVCKNRGKPTPTEIAKFNRQYKDLTVTYTDDFHDRFLIIDNAELHGLGSSINCLGRRVSSYTTRDAKEIAKLLAMVP